MIARRLLPLALLAALLSGCTSSLFTSTCQQSAQFGCIKPGTSTAWWLR